MIIVAGWISVAPEQRETYLDSCRAVVAAARAQPGCFDFSVSADLLDTGRINVFERWDSVESVERFRGSGTGDDQQALILGADVTQYTVTDIVPLT